MPPCFTQKKKEETAVAYNKPKSWKKMKEANKKGPDGFRCLLGCMLRSSKGRDIRFTIVDEKTGNEIPVAFNDGKAWVMGSEADADTMLVWISRYPNDIERLFYAAAQDKVGKMELAMDIAVAKLADLSGRKGRPAKVVIASGTSTHVVEITRSGKAPVYKIDGVQTDPREAEQFIRDRYITFMIGYKSAAKALENGVENRQLTNISNARPKNTAGEKLQPIDIEARLGQAGTASHVAAKKWPKQLLGEQFLSGGMKGYVGTRKEDNNGKG